MRCVLLASLLLSFVPTVAAAQDLDPVRIEKRVTRLESEMRAVQRKIFPGGDPKYFEPEIAPPAPAPAEPIGTPASNPLSDLTERVGQLEAQLRTLTGQVETNQFKLKQLEDSEAKLRGDLEFRLNALEAAANGAAPAAGATAAAAAMPGPPPAAARPDPVAKPPARPATADAAWKAAYADVLAKKWPETEAAMTDFIAAWPKSPRIPQAQYWLGRSHAERDEHAQAAKAYLELYQTAPRSDRAPDALIGLATAMNGLKKPKDACRVLGELDSVYGDKLTGGQKAEAKAQASKAKCPG